MGQKKLIRFQEIETFSNVLQYPKDMQGKWNDYFKNDNPITLELACGKGEYAVGLGYCNGRSRQAYDGNGAKVGGRTRQKSPH